MNLAFAPCGYSIESGESPEALTIKIDELMTPNNSDLYWVPLGPPQPFDDQWFQAMVQHNAAFFRDGL